MELLAAIFLCLFLYMLYEHAREVKEKRKLAYLHEMMYAQLINVQMLHMEYHPAPLLHCKQCLGIRTLINLAREDVSNGTTPTKDYDANKR